MILPVFGVGALVEDRTCTLSSKAFGRARIGSWRIVGKRLPSSPLIERAPSYMPSFTALPKRASD
jgi:hypothetical protein